VVASPEFDLGNLSVLMFDVLGFHCPGLTNKR